MCVYVCVRAWCFTKYIPDEVPRSQTGGARYIVLVCTKLGLRKVSCLVLLGR